MTIPPWNASVSIIYAVARVAERLGRSNLPAAVPRNTLAMPRKRGFVHGTVIGNEVLSEIPVNVLFLTSLRKQPTHVCPSNDCKKCEMGRFCRRDARTGVSKNTSKPKLHYLGPMILCYGNQ